MLKHALLQAVAAALMVASLTASVPAEPVGQEPGPSDVRTPLVPVPERVWDEDDTRRLVVRHGLPLMFVRIAARESGHDPDAKSRTDDYGLFQINGRWIDDYGLPKDIAASREALLDPERNARAAAFIFGTPNGYGHWMVCAESVAKGGLDCNPNR